MSRQEILLGALPSGIGGDTPRSANVKINAMTAELYARDASLGTAATRNTSVDGDIRPVASNVLKFGDWGLTGSPINMPITASFNDCTRTGNYIFGNSGQNGPGASIEGMTYCYVMVVGSSDGAFCSQEAVALNDEKRATRFLWDGNWSPWRLVYDQSTAVGVVGFSAAAGGRVPAGALMESGEVIDGNGSVHQWHKFATGLMLYVVQYNAGTTAAVPITIALYSAFTGNASCQPNQIPSYAWTTLRGYASGSSCVIYPDQTLPQSFMVTMMGMWG